MPDKKRPLPALHEGRLAPLVYERCLKRKAIAHLNRDRRRDYKGISGASYRDAIHHTTVQSQGRDAYPDEALDWKVISQYDNDESELGRRHYMAGFALLPTVDHIESASPKSGFCICAWRTNDAMDDLSYQAFLGLCRTVLEHAGHTIGKDAQPCVPADALRLAASTRS